MLDGTSAIFVVPHESHSSSTKYGIEIFWIPMPLNVMPHQLGEIVLAIVILLVMTLLYDSRGKHRNFHSRRSHNPPHGIETGRALTQFVQRGSEYLLT